MCETLDVLQFYGRKRVVLTITQLQVCENLVGYSITNPAIFKRHQLLPVRDLKLLVRDYAVR
jgi:hypothetical protein